jgi:hypothetical protein
MYAAAAMAGAASSSVLAAGSRVSGMLPQRWNLEGLKEYKNSKLQHMRPWREMIDRNRIGRPGSWEMAKERVQFTFYMSISAFKTFAANYSDHILRFSNLICVTNFHWCR